MDDIEKLKKISKLSAELKRHGFAASSDDAIRKSEEIFQEKILAPHGMQDAVPRQSQSFGGSNMEDFESYKKTTQAQMKELQDTVSQVVGKMNEMIKAINDLENGQKNMVRSSVSSAPRPSQPEPQRFSQSEMRDHSDTSKTLTPKPEKGSESNQRAGNYTPADVDINKIFYAGKK